MSARVVAMTRGTLRAMHQFLVEALNLPTGTSLALSDKVLDIQGLFSETLTAARATAVVNLNALRAEHPQLTPTILTPIAQVMALLESIKSNDLLQIGLVSLNLSEWQRAVDFMESAHHQLALGDGDRAVQTVEPASLGLPNGS